MEDYAVKVVDTKGSIVFENYDQIKNALAEQMEVYKSLEITEDGKQTAKKDVATLRKIKKAIEDRRKDIKKSFNEPYNEFEAKVKDLTFLIDEPISMITTKLDEFETKRIAEKRQHIKELWDKNITVPGIDISVFYDLSWENVSTSDTAILSDISGINLKYETGKQTLDAFTDIEPEEIEKATRIFVSNKLDITFALAEINHYRDTKKMIEQQAKEKAEREAQQKIEEAKREEEKRIAAAREQARSEAEDQFRREAAAVQSDIDDAVKDIENEREDEDSFLQRENEIFNNMLEPEREKTQKILSMMITDQQYDRITQWLEDNDIEYEEI